MLRRFRLLAVCPHSDAMAWRLAPAQRGDEQQGEVGQKRARTAAGAAAVAQQGGGSEASSLTEMMIRVQKLSLQSATAARQLSGSVWTTLLVPQGAPGVEEGKSAGGQYHSQTVGRPAHGLGPPQIHVFMAYIEKQVPEQDGDKQFLQHLRQTLESGGKEVVQDFVTFFRIREMRGRPQKGGGKGEQRRMEVEDDSGEKRVILNMHFNMQSNLKVGDEDGARVAVRLRSLLVSEALRHGATLAAGSAPPGQAERAVQADLNRLQRRQG